jgi:predicted signal transduction protein with EAL and GGDEF domain
MDDFGTGYSSLRYLQAFPFDKIKVDKSFIDQLDENLQSQAIIRAVVGLAHGLSLPVLAEGVETSGQLEFQARGLRRSSGLSDRAAAADRELRRHRRDSIGATAARRNGGLNFGSS